jgi:hypothetical protein
MSCGVTGRTRGGLRFADALDLERVEDLDLEGWRCPKGPSPRMKGLLKPVERLSLSEQRTVASTRPGPPAATHWA